MLIFYEWSISGPGIALVDRELRAALEGSPYQVEIYAENLEANLFPLESSQREFRDWYIHKYRNLKPDVIIAEGPPSVKFMLDAQNRFSPGTPVVVCCSPELGPSDLHLGPQFTGALMGIAPAKTLETALHLQPRTSHVVVVGGVSAFDKRVEDITKKSLRDYEGRLEFTYLIDLELSALLERLRHLPANTIVLYTSLSRDAAGTPFIDATETLPLVARAANAPVFSMADVFVGGGTVGGYVTSYVMQGRIAGETALRILRGEKPSDIPIVRESNVYMFDWRALRRWGLTESKLPPGSIVLNRMPTFWELWKRYVIAAIFLILVQTLIIIGLLWQRAKRRRTEAELMVSNERLRLAAESANSVGWDWDVKTGRTSRFGDLRTMFGIPSNTSSGRIEDFYDYVHPEDRKPVSQAVADAMENHEPYAAEFRVVWPDGTLRWVTATGQFYYSPKGEPQRMLGMAQDITERKRVEEALRESEERLRLAVQAGRMYAFEWDIASDVIVRSGQCRDILNWMDDPTRDTGQQFVARVHPDDREAYVSPETWLNPENPIYQTSYRVLRPDGTVLWLEASGRVLFDAKGKRLGIVGLVADVTARKLAEEALRQSEARERARVKELETLLDAAPITILLAADPECKRITGNRTASELHHVPIGTNFSKSAFPVGPPLPCRIMRDGVEIPVEELPLQRAAATGRAVVDASSTLVFENGTERHMIGNAAPLFGEDGKPCGAVGAFVDITERKRAEEALRESEQRFRVVANAAPVMIWMSGPDKLCTYFNQPWLEFTGRSIEAELGNGWADGVHADDLKACLESYAKAFDRQDSFKIEYRLRRHDGEYRWVFDNGVPRFSACGTFEGYIGSCIDVTARKLAEEALSTVSRRLIEAHEEERTHIARELHDDINQRIALLAVNLERLKQYLPAGGDTSGRIDEVREQLSELGSDVQSLSHRLHSSKLDYLGLSAAAASFCREISDRHKVPIDFHAVDVPKKLPQEISLCLFRVLQEGLQNAVKHSRSPQFHVRLGGASHEISLSVSDSGVGFNPDLAFQGQGLGLTSMKERLKLVGGVFSVDSQLDCGTTIHARVPLGVAAMSAYAGQSKH